MRDLLKDKAICEAGELPNCKKCGKKIDPEVPIQIGDPLICDICADQGEETKG